MALQDLLAAEAGAPTALHPLTKLEIGEAPWTLHHVGVAVQDLGKALEHYVGSLGFQQVSEPVFVPSQKVSVCFVQAGPGALIELVEPTDDSSPVAPLLARSSGGPYHLCYKVKDLEEAIAKLKRLGCGRVRRFRHGERRFAFLVSPEAQVFELCQEDEPIARSASHRRFSFHTLFFEATRRCNLSCPMCMAGSNDHRWVRRRVAQELTTDEVEHSILATAKEIGIRVIAWSGGEFILRRDAVELVRRATDYGYESTVCSNAALLTRERLLELKEASGNTLVVAMGINSIEDESSWTRDTTCDRTLEVLDLCEELGIRRHVVVNVGRHNLATLEPTLAWLEKKGIPYNRSPFTARGNGRDYWDKLHFDRKEMEEVIHPALRKRPLGYISYTPFFLSPEIHREVSGGQTNVTVPQNPPVGCWVGSWLAVSAEGEVAPCGILADVVPCGNVREKTLAQIIGDSPVFNQLLDRSQLKGKCGRCRYKYTCGGCRAMAFFESGDLMGEDPTCFFEPEDESTVSEHEEETNRAFRHYLFMVRRAERVRERATRALARTTA